MMIAAIVEDLGPDLIERNSIGHNRAVQLLITAGDNPERLKSEASFAASNVKSLGKSSASSCVARNRSIKPGSSLDKQKGVQGSQFASMNRALFLSHHNLVYSMNRRGNCHDNALAGSFFNLLKRERICRRVYPSRDEVRQDVFDCIEMFYNPKRKHVRNGMLSPVDFEKQQKI